MNRIRKKLERSYELLNSFIGSDSKRIAAAFQRLGKRATAQWVYRQGQPPETTKADDVQKFFRWKLVAVLTQKEREFRRIEVYGEQLARELKHFLGLLPFPAFDTETEERLLVIRKNLDAVLGLQVGGI